MQKHVFFHLNRITQYIYKWIESGLITEKTALSLMQKAEGIQKDQFTKHEAIQRIAKLFNILGTSLMISSILYFFASNWKAMNHLEKVAVVLATMFVPYFLSFVFKPHQKLYKQLSLFSGVFIFGVAVALIGQSYNSHADSYLLFFVWSVPVILFSIIIRFEPFYVLSIVLVNLSGWFYIKSYFFSMEYPLFLKMFLLNLFLTGVFYISENITKTGRYAKYIAFICAAFYLYVLTFYSIVKWNLIITNVLFIGLIISVGLYHLRKKLDVPMVYISFVISIFYILSKYIEITLYNSDDDVFLLMIFLGFGLIALNYFIFDKVNLAIKRVSNEHN